MARKEARIFTGIWGELEWRSLSAGAQWMYLFLISQPDIAHDGVISLRERRWAKNAAGVTPGEITGWLKELEGAGYVVADLDTEEVMVRSFMRHDQVFLQPNLMASAVAHLPGVESRRIRRAIFSECSRIIRENSDRARAAAGEKALTEKQKIPIRQMITILRATGDAELAIEGPAVQPTEVPAGSTVINEHPRDDLRSFVDAANNDPVDVDLRSVRPVDGGSVVSDANDPRRPGETNPSADDLRSVVVSATNVQPNLSDSGTGSVVDRATNDPDLRSVLGHVDTPPYDASDPLRPAGLNPSPNPSGKPLGDRGMVTKVSTGAPIPYPLSPRTTNGHDLRSTFAEQDDLFAALPGGDDQDQDPLLDQIGTVEPDREYGRTGTAFDRFWAVYPLKLKKAYARQCWDRAIRRAKVSPEEIIRGAIRYRDDPNRSDAYTAHPSSWLNQDRWADEPLPPRDPGRLGYHPAKRGATAAMDAAAQRRRARDWTPGGEITDGRR